MWIQIDNCQVTTAISTWLAAVVVKATGKKSRKRVLDNLHYKLTNGDRKAGTGSHTQTESPDR